MKHILISGEDKEALEKKKKKLLRSDEGSQAPTTIPHQPAAGRGRAHQQQQQRGTLSSAYHSQILHRPRAPPFDLKALQLDAIGKPPPTKDLLKLGLRK